MKSRGNDYTLRWTAPSLCGTLALTDHITYGIKSEKTHLAYKIKYLNQINCYEECSSVNFVNDFLDR